MDRFALRLSTLVSFVGLAIGCNGTASIDVGVGPYEYAVSASMISVPTALQDPSTMTVATIPCTTDSDCPSLGDGEPAIRCTNSACDPDPFTFSLASDVIDLDTIPAIAQFGGHIAALTVTSINYTATASGLQNSVGPTELYWGPPSVPMLDVSQVTHFGTIPVLQLPTGSSTSGQVVLDTDGANQLSNYLVNTSHQLRLFASPGIDLTPGGPLPSGAVTIDVSMTVHVVGQLVR